MGSGFGESIDTSINIYIYIYGYENGQSPRSTPSLSQLRGGLT